MKATYQVRLKSNPYNMLPDFVLFRVDTNEEITFSQTHEKNRVVQIFNRYLSETYLTNSVFELETWKEKNSSVWTDLMEEDYQNQLRELLNHSKQVGPLIPETRESLQKDLQVICYQIANNLLTRRHSVFFKKDQNELIKQRETLERKLRSDFN